MKIKMGPYPNPLTCNIHTRYMHDRYGLMDWPPTQTKFEDCLEKLEEFIQGIYNVTLNKLLRKEQKVSVKIDRWDTWGMDHTLAHIIVPMLKQLKAAKHGCPIVDWFDVPTELWSTDEDRAKLQKDAAYLDSNFFKRWEWIMDEMIWAFEQQADNESEDKFLHVDEKGKFTIDRKGLAAHDKRMRNGFVLFGKYYSSLWD